VLKKTQTLEIDNSFVRVAYARQNNAVTQNKEHVPANQNKQVPVHTPLICDVKALEGVPDAEEYVYDLDSGFYFNPNINFYFDAKTRYFYDINEKTFYSYDETLQQFVKLESASSALVAMVFIGGYQLSLIFSSFIFFYNYSISQTNCTRGL
jgi:hypothetical protein